MANHPNRSKHRRVKIALLGGYPALVDFHEDNEEGDIVMGEAFMAYIHDHTRKDAIAKAERIAPHVTKWTCVS